MSSLRVWTARLSAVLVILAAATTRSVEAVSCYEQPIDVHYVLHVQGFACNFYEPGNKELRGVRAVFQGNVYDSEGSMVDCTLVNQSFPGPVVRAKLGDFVRVDVINSLESTPISFHWHGLNMADWQWADGASYVTSCPVEPGRPQTYIFQVDRAGTYFYHGHTGLDEEHGLAGALIVDDPKDPYTDLYDEEWPNTTISLRDWWRAPQGHLTQAHRFYFYEKFNPFGIPTINGLYGNGTERFPFPVLNVAANTCYRTRIIAGDTHWPGWNISIHDAAGHPVNMTLLALSAEDLHPVNMESFAIYIAQRAELVICTPSEPQDLNMSIWGASYEAGYCQKNVMPGPTQDDNTFPIGPNCIDHFYAIIRVGGITTNVTKTANRTKLASFPFYSGVDSLISNVPIVPLVPRSLPKASKTWTIQSGMTYITPTAENGYEDYHNMFMWDNRQYQFGLPTAPYLFTQGKCGTSPHKPGGEPHGKVNVGYNLVKKASKNQVIDIVFNNLTPYMHPMHLHGHRFTMIASKFIVQAGYDFNTLAGTNCPNSYKWGDQFETRSPGELLHNFLASNFTTDFPFFYGCPYNASDPTNSQYNIAHPFETDIALVPAHSWAIVRVRINNPGFWFLHCHILSHMIYGMGFVVDAFSAEAPTIPSWVDTSCGGSCHPRNQFCGDYAYDRNCVQSLTSNRDICKPK